ncbi:MAG: hypothetical protein GX278_03765 [Aeromonadales bacterium]|nr:hypothetical protein [Aeromonadales bacterium]
MKDKLSSTKPFLFTAYYDWMVDNEITPHILVDANFPGVIVPQEFIKDGSIILSLKPAAIFDYKCLKSGISFKARFKGVSQDIYIPYLAMEDLIALETGTSFPIGKALEQLELAPAEDLIDDINDDFSPEFEVEDNSSSSEQSSEQSSLKTEKAPEVPSEPGFEFVKD